MKAPLQKIYPKMRVGKWYRCYVCFEALFKAKCVVGAIGGAIRGERRLLIVNWTDIDGIRFGYFKRKCTEGVSQYSSYCPTCGIALNAPVQNCLARMKAPTKRKHFRNYRSSLKRFSKRFQVIRTILLIDPEIN